MLSIPLKNLSTNNLNFWNQSILVLAKNKKPSQSLLKLEDGGIKTLLDLVWLFPLRLQKAPKVSDFNKINDDQLFFGRGKVINIRFTPAFGKRGKRGIQLFNCTCVVKDIFSEKYLNLKWFNTYPSLKKQLEALEEFSFLGQVSLFQGSFQIINPTINPKDANTENGVLVEYPTFNTVPGKQIEKFVRLIPKSLWDIPISNLESEFLKNKNLNNAFLAKHGLIEYSKDNIELADKTLKYFEFFSNQLKVLARKYRLKGIRTEKISFSKDEKYNAKKLLPYELTIDQENVFESILEDFSSGKPMMRMVQGDVGCGKTTLAILATYLMSLKNKQSAIMCPTEALATQHANTFQEVLGERLNISLMLGSTKKKDKERINDGLKSGEIDLVIGTHSLIQDSVEFKNLALAIIDEQHKFGVEQRQKLSKKGEATHTMIMSATPIPRTLQLVQYGDLDISTIRVMPSGRKGTQTRIVTTNTYQKYLSFLKTRMSMGEQVYVVAPAIEENEIINIKNVNSILEVYKKYFPEYKLGVLHGQLKSHEKSSVLTSFEAGEIDLLISTTVIEVGINILNSTVISIYNPDRFGLSSLHQLRGRVGRGSKPGFCFLVTDQNTSPEAITRLRVIEKSNDGFEIAEADLQNRGMGDIFGVNQSGHTSPYKLANIFEDREIFDQVNQDVENLKIHRTETLNNYLLSLIEDTKVSSTI